MSMHRNGRRVRRLTRRDFLRTTGLAVGGLAIGPTLLAACGDDDGTTAGTGTTGTGPATTRGGNGGATGRLNVSNWPFYIDPTEDGATGSVDLFEQETGIQVTYTEDINDNVEYFAKIQGPLSAGQRIDADIIVLTDWMASRLINNLGWAEELDKSLLPNVEANLVENLRNVSFDPDRSFSVPWQSGIAGIAYNTALANEILGRDVTSADDLFDPALAGRVTMLTEMRDTVGVIALGMGIDIESITFEQAEPVFDRIEEAAQSGQIRRFTGNDYGDDLASGNVVAAVAWSGDVVQLQLDNPDLRFLIPEEGATLWSDNMLIPKGAQNYENAHRWMDYFYDPVNAARVAAWVQFIPPVEGVKEELEAIDPELANNPLIIPDDETAARLFVFKRLDEDEEAQFDERFESIIRA
jgi:spermidine/putrescine transport system substrate-binding protein